MSFHRLLLVLIAAACLLPAATVFAQTLRVPTSVNGIDAGDQAVEIAGDDVHMRAADLETFGAGGPVWQRLIAFGRLRRLAKPIEGSEAVSLKSLEPYLDFKLDPESLTLALTVKPELLKANVVESHPTRPADIIYSRDRTAFFNYAITSPSLHDYTFFGELGATLGKGLLYSGVSRAQNGNFVRGLTNFTYDETAKLRRWVAGDSFAATETLGGTALITGVTVSRNFELDPYFVRYPSLDLRGTAVTPSQVDVYVNGVLVGRHEIAPGPFVVRDVPITAGAGNTEIVVRDAFGRVLTSSASYYFGTNVLTPGLSEYLYSAGVQREDFGIRSFKAGDAAGVAYHRVGINHWLTVGGRAEATRAVASGGPIIDFRTRIGEFRVAGAYSRDHGQSGNAAELGYRYISRHFGIGGSMVRQSRDYGTVSMPASADRPLSNETAFAAFSGRWGSVTGQWSRIEMRDTGNRQSRATLGFAVPIGSRLSALASASRVTENGATHNEYFAGASVNVGYQTTASASVSTIGNGHSNTLAEIARPLPIGTGYGYRLQTLVDEHGNRTDVGDLQYQTNFGRYEIAEDPGATDRRPTIGASGALVFAGKSIHFTQPVQASYVLVEVPGVSNVRVFASNQLVGRTDYRGNLLVPNLLAYYGNPLRIEDKDVPMTYEVPATDRTIAPPYRGGAVVVFPVKRHQSITGTVAVVKGGDRVRPALGTLTITSGGQSWDSPVGREGEFYLEDVPSGTYDAEVTWKDGRCSFQLAIPSGTAATVKLGEVSCSRIE